MAEPRRVAVALSGGVDSAVAAALLKSQGWEVMGVHLRLSSHGPPAAHLAALARTLGFDLEVMDLSGEFNRLVVDYFVGEYSQGRTPNPCVRCNAVIKFGLLWSRVQAAGCDFLATGHYARILAGPGGDYGLHRGLDRTKDQSYFLSRVPRELLLHLRFPLGELTKAWVTRHYQELGLPPPISGRESMEVCFLGGEHHAAFIRERRGYPGSPGQLVDRQNRVLGRHRGLEHYTVGQRRGLGVPAKEPYYVVALAPAANRVILGTREELLAPGLTATEVNWLIPPPAGPMEAIAVIRYRHPGAAARLTPQEGDTVQVEFAQPQRAVAPGQAVAFYRGDRVIAGGWIASPMT